MLDGVGNHYTTFVPLDLLIKVPVLQGLYLFSITIPQEYGIRLYVCILNVARAIGKTGDRIE